MQATGVAEHPAKLADVLTHREHARVEAHFLGHRLGHGAGDGEFALFDCCGHGCLLEFLAG
ncbi:hypothetical protein D3C86_1793570 [compost metagenome]